MYSICPIFFKYATDQLHVSHLEVHVHKNKPMGYISVPILCCDLGHLTSISRELYNLKTRYGDNPDISFETILID